MQIIKTIDANIAKTWVDTNEAVIIDVREPGEYEELHIEGAKLIPLGSLCHDLLPELHGKKLIIHCLHGKRGSVACERLLQSNPELDIYNLEGGITAWVNAGFRVVKGSK
jgi:rhodanese-related sulfurtransferase